MRKDLTNSSDERGTIWGGVEHTVKRHHYTLKIIFQLKNDTLKFVVPTPIGKSTKLTIVASFS